jgi:hypothetical protein
MKISAYTKRLSVAALVLGVAVGCATAPEQEAETCEGISPDVQAAIDEAKSVNADARAMGAEWRGARKIINDAEAAGADRASVGTAADADKALEQLRGLPGGQGAAESRPPALAAVGIEGELRHQHQSAARLLEDPGLWDTYSRRARERAVERFSAGRVVPMYEEYYREILTGDGSRTGGLEADLGATSS